MVTLAPDATLVAVQYLAAHPAITAITAITASDAAHPHVGTQLRNPRDANTITVVRIPSGAGYRDSRAHWSDEAHLDINCWSVDQQSAYLLAATARAALMDLASTVTQPGVVVDVEDLGGPGWLPDSSENPPIPRYVFSISITTHP